MSDEPFYIDGEKQKLYHYFGTANIIDQDIIKGTYAENMKTGEYLKDFGTVPDQLGLDENVAVYEFEFYPEDEEQYAAFLIPNRKVTVSFSYDPAETRAYYQFFTARGMPEINLSRDEKNGTIEITASLDLFDFQDENTYFEIEGKNVVIVTGEDIHEGNIRISTVTMNNGEKFTGQIIKKEMKLKDALDLITESRFKTLYDKDEYDAEKEIQAWKNWVYRSFCELRDNGYIWAYHQQYDSWVLREPEDFYDLRVMFEQVMDFYISGKYGAFTIAEVHVPAGGEVTARVDFRLGFQEPIRYSRSGTRLTILPPPPSDMVYESYDFSIDFKNKPATVFIGQNMGLKNAGDGIKSASLDPYYDGYQILFSGDYYYSTTDFSGYTR